MGDHDGDTILSRVEKIEEHAQALVEACRTNRWQDAEMALRNAQIALQAVARYVEMANDIQRGQIR